jgi:hypothetical protein
MAWRRDLSPAKETRQSLARLRFEGFFSLSATPRDIIDITPWRCFGLRQAEKRLRVAVGHCAPIKARRPMIAAGHQSARRLKRWFEMEA